MAQTTLDIAIDDDESPSRDEVVRAYEIVFGVEAELVNERGPAGGWPEYTFTGATDALIALLRAYMRDNEVSEDELLELIAA